jgi:putative MATE family efflux protein
MVNSISRIFNKRAASPKGKQTKEISVRESEMTDRNGNSKPAPQTKGVQLLMGDPKKAILRLSIPMIIWMGLQTLYNFVDAAFVARLGVDALNAIGFFFPFFFVLIAIATGLGIGANASLSRFIGKKDKESADNVTVHSLIIMMATGIAVAVLFLAITRPLFTALGAEGNVLEMVIDYGVILFAAAPLLFFFNWGISILRGEGDMKRVMIVGILGSVLNIILDPIFIFTLDMGVAGAAWATAVAFLVSALLLVWWMFIKRDTYVTIRKSYFKYSRAIVKDIMKVGIPATVMQITMAISAIILNVFIIGLNEPDGIGTLTTGWRMFMVAILPLIGISTAVVSVTGAAYGAKNYAKLKTAFNYAIKLGIMVEVVVSVAIFVFAAQISAVFTAGPNGDLIYDDLVLMLQILSWHFPLVAFGMFSSSMFQGTGKGVNALAVTILRTIIITGIVAYILAFTLDMGLVGIFWGISVGNMVGATLAYFWARYYISCLGKGKCVEKEEMASAKSAEPEHKGILS